ncbi:MAG: site-specific DNA-methyltransferase [Gammaproteobacteria bacterium]|nr:site-specific DNA-methyltransferase [Gammaproteobacteria bacterium]
MPTLNWLTREADIRAATRVEYRLLEEVAEHSSGEGKTANMLIHGDNLDALKALLPFYAGRVKCIYIDPPYNTRSAFEQYDDNLEHTRWLAMMWPRLELLRELLSEDGSIWVSIDDNEAHYLKVVMDEVMGRSSFVADIVWQRTHTRENRTDISNVHDNILVYAKNRAIWREIRNPLPKSEEQLQRFKNPDGDPRGRWASLPIHAKAEKGRRREQFFTITLPSGRELDPPPGRCWLYTEDRFLEMCAEDRIWFGENGNNAPRLKSFLSEVQSGLVPSTHWSHKEVGTTGTAKSEVVSLFEGETPFSTPKPEALIERVVHIATNAGDLVLDSFLGSGTTAAVAHKMGRRWIGVEMGEHAVTHCAPRLQKVIDGDEGGISERVGWKGGGGFRFYRLGPPAFDADGRIRPDIQFSALAAHVWFSETGTPWDGDGCSPLLGIHDGRAWALLYNGVLGDRREDGGNVLTRGTLALIREKAAETEQGFAGPLTVYGEQSRLATETLEGEGIVFKQTPYDIESRA